MRHSKFRFPILLSVLALGLSGCAYGTYGGLGAGYGSGYYTPYGSSSYGYGRPYYGTGYGWYDGFYYPGSGRYVYNRYGRRVRWNDRHRSYWQGGGVGASGHAGYFGLPSGLRSTHVGVTAAHGRVRTGNWSAGHRSSRGHGRSGHRGGH